MKPLGEILKKYSKKCVECLERIPKSSTFASAFDKESRCKALDT